MQIGYHVVSYNPNWINEDAKMVICNDTIPPMPTLSILYPCFRVISALHNSRLLKPFAIAFLYPDLDKIRVAVEILWYYHDRIALPLFSE